jgi:hypothetical protein
MPTMTEAEIYAAARDWLADCSWQDLEPEDFAELTDTAIKRGVSKHFAGGWEAFLESCGVVDVSTTTVVTPGPRARLSALAV